MKKSILIAFLIVFSLMGRKLQVKQYTVGEGLIQNNPFAISQMSNHEMVFITISGVSFYDGVEFRTSPDSVFKKYLTTAVVIGNQLWLGSINEGIYIFENEHSFPAESINAILPGKRINQILPFHDSLIVATDKGILVKSSLSYKVYNQANGLLSNVVLRLHVDMAGNIWFTTPIGFGVIKRNGNVVNFDGRDRFRNPFCQSILVDRKNRLWVGTRQGLYVANSQKLINSHDLTIGKWLHTPQLRNDFINSILEDQFGSIWMGTKRGLLKYEGNSKANEINSNEIIDYTLKNYFIRRLFIDAEQNIWAATRGAGVLKIQGDIFWTYDLEDGLLNQEVLSIYQTSDKKMWFGTNKGAATLLPTGKFRVYTVKNGLPHNIVTSFLEFKPGYLILGTWRGLALKHGIRISRFEPPHLKYYHTFKVLDIVKLSEKKLMLGTAWGIWYFDIQTKKFIKENKIKALSRESIIDLKKKNDSIVYVCKKHDLYKYNIFSRSIESINQKLPRKIRTITAMAIWGDQLLVGTTKGIWIIREDSLEHNISGDEFLVNDWVMSIQTVNDSIIWIGGNKGVSQITRKKNGSFFAKKYSSKNGFIGEEIITPNSMYTDADGDEWFGTFIGVSKYNASKDFINKTPPHVQIKKLRIFQRESEQHTQLNLKYNENTIAISYIGISFRDEKDVIYRYRLIGYQDEWSEPTTSRTVNFYNLPSGDYQFEVIAANRDGIWSQTPASTRIRIFKPFWEEPLFVILVVLGILALSMLWFRRQVNKVNREKEILENKVQQRTKTLIEQQKRLLETNEELEKLTAELQQSMEQLKNAQVHLVQSEKMVSLGTLIAGVTHELNNPVTFIYSNFSSLKDYLDSIFRLIEAIRDEYLENNERVGNIYKDEDIDYIIEDLPQLLSGIEYGTNRIKDIVMQLYRFSHPGQSSEQVDIHQNIELTLNLFLNQYRRQITINKDFSEVPTTNIPGGELNQVFLNIFVNAAHAIVKTKGSGNIWITTKTNQKFIDVSIRDDGGGIPQNIRNKIFDPFFTTKSIGQGTGLGLSLSFTIMQNMGGKIYFKPHEDGAEFIIQIPIK